MQQQQQEQRPVPRVPIEPHEDATARNCVASQTIVQHWTSGRKALVMGTREDQWPNGQILVQYFDEWWVGAIKLK